MTYICVNGKQKHSRIFILLFFCIGNMFTELFLFCLTFQRQIIDNTNKVSPVNKVQCIGKIFRHIAIIEGTNIYWLFCLSVELYMQVGKQ